MRGAAGGFCVAKKGTVKQVLFYFPLFRIMGTRTSIAYYISRARVRDSDWRSMFVLFAAVGSRGRVIFSSCSVAVPISIINAGNFSELSRGR